MGSFIECCADLDERWDGMTTREMDWDDRAMALLWMNDRIHNIRPDAHDFPADWLPDTGLAAVDKFGKTIAVAFLYLEKSSPVAVMGWMAADPANVCRESHKAINLLVADIPLYAKRKGAKYLLSTFGNRSINSILEHHGFVAGEACENKFLFL